MPPSAESPPTLARTPGLAEARPRPPRARILVADASQARAEALARVLRADGHDPVPVGDGRTAFERLLRSDQEFDLLLVDPALPRLSGRCLLEQAACWVREATPVIVIASQPRALESLEGIRPWVHAVLIRPVGEDVLRRRVQEALETRALYAARHAGETTTTRLHRRIDFLIREVERLHEDSRRDPLTGLPGRLALRDDLEARADPGPGAPAGPYAIVLCDLDGFRRVNAELGYRGGDEVLRRFARTLRAALRAGDRVYRYGGDEFVVILDARTLADAVAAMGRLQRRVAKIDAEAAGDRAGTPITFSAGLVLASPGRPAPLDEVIQGAGTALRNAKQAGGSCVRSLLLGMELDAAAPSPAPPAP